MVEQEGCKDSYSDAAPAGNKDVPCLLMALVLIELQGHTIILLWRHSPSHICTLWPCWSNHSTWLSWLLLLLHLQHVSDEIKLSFGDDNYSNTLQIYEGQRRLHCCGIFCWGIFCCGIFCCCIFCGGIFGCSIFCCGIFCWYILLR